MAGDTPTCVGAACAEEETPRRAEKRGLCNRCYLRWWKATPPDQRAPLPLADRLRTNLTPGGPDDCHEWRGARDDNGYGLISVNGRPRKASRMALICALGRDEPGMDACHTCDNPPCCNPRHLYFGTRKQNVHDALTRNRMPLGEQRKQARLTDSAVLAIRTRFAAGERTKDLAAEYGVRPTTITSILRGRKWRHVGGPIVPAGTPQIRARRAA